MVAPRLQAVELAIQHVRNRSERMPVSGMHVGERPLNPAWRKTICNPCILDDVTGIVVTYELVPKRLAKCDPDNYCKKNRDDGGDHSTAMSGRTAALGCMEPQSLFPPIRSLSGMFSKTHTAHCGKIAIDLALATISRHVFRATSGGGESKRKFGQFIRSNQLDKYTC